MEELEAYEEMMEEENLFQNERDEKEEELWAHDPDTGEKTFYLGCLMINRRTLVTLVVS